MCCEEIGHGEHRHARCFSRLHTRRAVFKHHAGFGRDIEFCSGFEVNFRVGFEMRDIAAGKNGPKNVADRGGIDVRQNAVLERGVHAVTRRGRRNAEFVPRGLEMCKQVEKPGHEGDLSGIRNRGLKPGHPRVEKIFWANRQCVARHRIRAVIRYRMPNATHVIRTGNVDPLFIEGLVIGLVIKGFRIDNQAVHIKEDGLV